ncbi:MAG: replication protein, partial [Nitrospirae bacterium]|nr:replication protein [Nitrospirota bacterium]MBF0618530.1 replication protein [Nitrospirota bacterium]
MTPPRSQNQSSRKALPINSKKREPGSFFLFPYKVIEALYSRDVSPDLSKYEMRIFLFIVRVTMGWNRAYAKVSFKELSENTQIDRRSCQRSLSNLLKKNMVLKKGGGPGAPTYYGINEDISKWID